MVQTKGLRIGNWLFGTDPLNMSASAGEGYFKVENIEEERINVWRVDGFSDESANGSPIPLTPDILEKCGFEKHGNSNEYWTFYQLKNGWYVAWSHHDEPSAGVKKGFTYYGDSYHKIKYLHQLQNLYYELTRAELTINL